MERAVVKVLARTGHEVSPQVLGHNLEMFERSNADLCSDRLENPKFAGPADASTGIARGWHPPSSKALTTSVEDMPAFREGLTRAAASPYDLQAPAEPARFAAGRIELPPLSLTRLFAPARVQ